MNPLAPQEYRQVPGEFYGTPKEIWGFRSARTDGTPLQAARAFLRANEALFGLGGIRTQLKRSAVIASLGADHVILQQQHHGARMHRAYVTVHIGRRDRRVYLVKNRAMPRHFLPAAPQPGFGRSAATDRTREFLEVSGLHSRCLGTEALWYPFEERLIYTWKVRMAVRIPEKRREEWIVYLDASTGEVISYYDNLAHVTARARVFMPNPVIALGDHRLLLDARGRPVRKVPESAYRDVTLRDLQRTGYLDGKRVTTAPTGQDRVRRGANGFVYTSRQRGFEEAMVYYHIDAAIRYLETLGYRGRQAIFRSPLPVNVRGTREDQSWYSPGRRMLFFGLGGGVNDAEDAETILHEFGHALQDAICPDFGQSAEAAAMGEGFGDYLALSFFADRPKRYASSVMTWDGITCGNLDPPCVRRLDSGWTYADFNEADGEHDNGEIWAEVLLDVFRALGKKAADKLIIESHFQLDGFTTFARGARAMLDADRNLYRGRYRTKLLGVFRKRKIAPVG